MAWEQPQELPLGGGQGLQWPMASTSLLCSAFLHSLRPGMDKEVLGILVSYKVKVNLMVSRGGWVLRIWGTGTVRLGCAVGPHTMKGLAL